jgi:pimeloyl-ACP methyl ester carboxylesterase
MPEQVRSTSLTTARGQFAILEAQPTRGVRDRKPALLIPGYTGSKENFLPILEPLAAAGRAVVAVDMRGQYQSPHAADRGGYSAAALAADVLAIADAVGRESGDGVHLVGHSLGGLLAREAVLQRPSGFLSLTLLGSGPGTIAGQRAAALRQLLAVLDPGHDDHGHDDQGHHGASHHGASHHGASHDDKARLADLVRQIWHDQEEPQARAEGTDEHIIAFLKERTLRTCPIGLIVLARYLLDCADRTDELAAAVAAGLPALVVYGENDDAWPPAEQDLMARRLGAGRACIPGAAHSPAIDAPVTTAAILTDFWNGAERRQPTVHVCGRSPRSAGHAKPGGSAQPQAADANVPTLGRALDAAGR